MVFPRGIRLDRLENVPGANDPWDVIVVSGTVSICLSGWGDLNSRPSVPQTDALTKLRHSPLWSGHSTGGLWWQVLLSAVR